MHRGDRLYIGLGDRPIRSHLRLGLCLLAELARQKCFVYGLPSCDTWGTRSHMNGQTSFIHQIAPRKLYCCLQNSQMARQSQLRCCQQTCVYSPMRSLHVYALCFMAAEAAAVCVYLYLQSTSQYVSPSVI